MSTKKQQSHQKSLALRFTIFFLSSFTITVQNASAIPRPWLHGRPTPLPLLSKTRVSPDAHVYRFGLSEYANDRPNDVQQDDECEDDKDNTLGIGVCSCILVSPPSNRNITRPYTPISSRHVEGSFDLLVKRYRNGAMGNELAKLKIGDPMIFWQIPFNIKEQYPFGNPDTIIMLAAGTGITPMYQALQRMFGSLEDKDAKMNTKVILLYGCRTKQDILLQKELEAIQEIHPDRFQIHYAISKEDCTAIEKGRSKSNRPTWKNGRIDKETLVHFLKAENILLKGRNINKNIDCRIWVCGPPSFYDDLSGPRGKEVLSESCILNELGFSSKNVIKF